MSESAVPAQLTPNPEFSVPASRESLERAQAALRAVNIETEIVPEQLLQLDRVTQRREMAKLATAPDYMIGSVHAVTERGDLVIGSGTGSQLAAYVNGAGHVILVAGAQKVVSDLANGLRRLREYGYPLEDARMKAAGYSGTKLAKTLIISFDSPGRTHLILVEESIGF